MSVVEIVCGVVLMFAALAIIVLTLSQESKGRGLSGAIMGGDAGMMDTGRARGKDVRMAKATKICGIVFVAVTILVSMLSAKLG